MSNSKEDFSGSAGKQEREILCLGFDNYVLSERIVAIHPSASLPAKRLREQADKENLLLDATAGRKTRAIVVTDSRHVILSSFSPMKIALRLNPSLGTKKDSSVDRCELEWKEGEFAS